MPGPKKAEAGQLTLKRDMGTGFGMVPAGTPMTVVARADNDAGTAVVLSFADPDNGAIRNITVAEVAMADLFDGPAAPAAAGGA